MVLYNNCASKEDEIHSISPCQTRECHAMLWVIGAQRDVLTLAICVARVRRAGCHGGVAALVRPWAVGSRDEALDMGGGWEHGGCLISLGSGLFSEETKKEENKNVFGCGDGGDDDEGNDAPPLGAGPSSCPAKSGSTLLLFAHGMCTSYIYTIRHGGFFVYSSTAPKHRRASELLLKL